MRNETLIQFMGFRTRPKLREYTFQVRGNGENPLEFLLTISNEAFLAHRVRYQDAPDICSHWIHRELEANGGTAPRTRCAISDADLEDYRVAHMPKAQRGMMYKPPREAY
jgi:hypothetical protein